MDGPALDEIEVRLTLSSNVVDRHDGTITTCCKVLYLLRKHYNTDTVIAKADEEIQNF